MDKEDSDSKHEDILALIANSDFDVDEEEEPGVSFQDIKIHTYSKTKLFSLFGILIDAYQNISAERNN